MSEPVKKPIESSPESYSPKKPEIVEEIKSSLPDFKEYKNILYKFKYLKLPDSFKFIALPNTGLNPFENIGIFGDKYKKDLHNTTGRDIGVGMYTNLLNDKFDYYFGQQVTSLDEIPDGLVGIDTHTKNYCVMTVCANSMYELVGDEKGPGDAMQTADEYISNIWLPQHRDIAVTDENGNCGKVLAKGKIYHTGNFEVYTEGDNMSDNNPQMCFYIPLKDGSIL